MGMPASHASSPSGTLDRTGLPSYFRGWFNLRSTPSDSEMRKSSMKSCRWLSRAIGASSDRAETGAVALRTEIKASGRYGNSIRAMGPVPPVPRTNSAVI